MNDFRKAQDALGYTNYEVSVVIGVAERTVERMRKRGENGPATRLLMVIAGLLDTDDLVRKTGRWMI